MAQARSNGRKPDPKEPDSRDPNLYNKYLDIWKSGSQKPADILARIDANLKWLNEMDRKAWSKGTNNRKGDWIKNFWDYIRPEIIDVKEHLDALKGFINNAIKEDPNRTSTWYAARGAKGLQDYIINHGKNYYVEDNLSSHKEVINGGTEEVDRTGFYINQPDLSKVKEDDYKTESKGSPEIAGEVTDRNGTSYRVIKKEWKKEYKPYKNKPPESQSALSLEVKKGNQWVPFTDAKKQVSSPYFSNEFEKVVTAIYHPDLISLRPREGYVLDEGSHVFVRQDLVRNNVQWEKMRAEGMTSEELAKKHIFRTIPNEKFVSAMKGPTAFGDKSDMSQVRILTPYEYNIDSYDKPEGNRIGYNMSGEYNPEKITKAIEDYNDTATRAEYQQGDFNLQDFNKDPAKYIREHTFIKPLPTMSKGEKTFFNDVPKEMGLRIGNSPDVRKYLKGEISRQELLNSIEGRMEAKTQAYLPKATKFAEGVPMQKTLTPLELKKYIEGWNFIDKELMLRQEFMDRVAKIHANNRVPTKEDLLGLMTPEMFKLATNTDKDSLHREWENYINNNYQLDYLNRPVPFTKAEEEEARKGKAERTNKKLDVLRKWTLEREPDYKAQQEWINSPIKDEQFNRRRLARAGGDESKIDKKYVPKLKQKAIENFMANNPEARERGYLSKEELEKVDKRVEEIGELQGKIFRGGSRLGESSTIAVKALKKKGILNEKGQLNEDKALSHPTSLTDYYQQKAGALNALEDLKKAGKLTPAGERYIRQTMKERQELYLQQKEDPTRKELKLKPSVHKRLSYQDVMNEAENFSALKSTRKQARESILERLSPEHKEEFLNEMYQAPNEKGERARKKGYKFTPNAAKWIALADKDERERKSAERSKQNEEILSGIEGETSERDKLRKQAEEYITGRKFKPTQKMDLEQYMATHPDMTVKDIEDWEANRSKEKTVRATQKEAILGRIKQHPTLLKKYAKERYVNPEIDETTGTIKGEKKPDYRFSKQLERFGNLADRQDRVEELRKKFATTTPPPTENATIPPETPVKPSVSEQVSNRVASNPPPVTTPPPATSGGTYLKGLDEYRPDLDPDIWNRLSVQEKAVRTRLRQNQLRSRYDNNIHLSKRGEIKGGEDSAKRIHGPSGQLQWATESQYPKQFPQSAPSTLPVGAAQNQDLVSEATQQVATRDKQVANIMEKLVNARTLDRDAVNLGQKADNEERVKATIPPELKSIIEAQLKNKDRELERARNYDTQFNRFQTQASTAPRSRDIANAADAVPRLDPRAPRDADYRAKLAGMVSLQNQEASANRLTQPQIDAGLRNAPPRSTVGQTDFEANLPRLPDRQQVQFNKIAEPGTAPAPYTTSQVQEYKPPQKSIWDTAKSYLGMGDRGEEHPQQDTSAVEGDESASPRGKSIWSRIGGKATGMEMLAGGGLGLAQSLARNLSGRRDVEKRGISDLDSADVRAGKEAYNEEIGKGWRSLAEPIVTHGAALAKGVGGALFKGGGFIPGAALAGAGMAAEYLYDKSKRGAATAAERKAIRKTFEEGREGDIQHKTGYAGAVATSQRALRNLNRTRI